MRVIGVSLAPEKRKAEAAEAMSGHGRPVAVCDRSSSLSKGVEEEPRA